MYTVETRNYTDRGVLVTTHTYSNWYEDVVEWLWAILAFGWGFILLLLVMPFEIVSGWIYDGPRLIRTKSYYEGEEDE